MSSNTFGKILSLTTWGESHGEEIGAVLDGVPPNIEIRESFIQKYLNQRRPGSSKFVTQRKENDKIKIVSGLFEGKSTGTPIGLVIKNNDKRPIVKNMSHTDIKKLISERNKVYNFSDFKIICENLKKGEIVNKILQKCKKNEIIC